MASLMLLRGLRISLAPRPPLLLATRANNAAAMFHTATPLKRPGDYKKIKTRELKKRRPAREAKLREREREKFLHDWKVPNISPDSPEGQAMVEAHLEKWAAKREKDFLRRVEQKALRLEAEALEKERRKRDKEGPMEDNFLLKKAEEEVAKLEWEAMEEVMHQSER
ncbi:hypothetical protein DL766_002460 [Monosporascus sp. MC13-8B]|uniref:Uncharacterized protein n=1 Tax=Monosporascus cannonballus TaxID=155416 RepID=A0ABY0HDK5_9PEZI|nr:hypothetical protein DL762_002867 [Monosporascus cannonballus]RYO95604.1 hypothetical protein DL763_003674 [Monosporascus cannonballus]RYP35449.1 hypothetical protein DL766_002460 [Monosporascus sp. MC13-8B]